MDPLRDYPPEELDVWLRHAKEVQAKGCGFKSIVEPFRAELIRKGFIKEGQWNPLLRYPQEEIEEWKDE